MCTEIEAHEKVIEGLLGGLAQKNPKVLYRISRQTFFLIHPEKYRHFKYYCKARFKCNFCI